VIRIYPARRDSYQTTDTRPRERISSIEEFKNVLKNSDKRLKRVDIKGLDPKRPLNCSGIDLSGYFIDDVRLENCDFIGAKLKGASIFDSVLVGVDFSDADLSELEMRNSKATGITMIGTNLDRAQIVSSDLIACALPDVSLCNAKIAGCTLRNGSFQRADLTNMYIAESELEDLNFNEARAGEPCFTRATTFRNVSWRFAQVNLQCKDTEFEGADFSHSDLKDSPFIRCTFKAPIELEQCKGFYNLSGCTLNNVNLLPLDRMPDMIPQDQFYIREKERYSRFEESWKTIFEWWKPDDLSSPELRIHLKYYKKFIDDFDTEMRRFLREKMQTLMDTMPDLKSETGAIFEEIIALDDALTAAETNRSRANSQDTAGSESLAENQPPATVISNNDGRDNNVNSFHLLA